MALHDCQVIGTMTLKSNVTEAEVQAALQGFLATHTLNYANEREAGRIVIDEDEPELTLTLDYRGYGGRLNDSVQALAQDLAAVVQGSGYVESHDHDTGDPEARCVPYFIGGNELDQKMARLNYGIEQMEMWIEPLVGRAGFGQVAGMLRTMLAKRLTCTAG